jgi:hypothetical protein
MPAFIKTTARGLMQLQHNNVGSTDAAPTLLDAASLPLSPFEVGEPVSFRGPQRGSERRIFSKSCQGKIPRRTRFVTFDALTGSCWNSRRQT